MTKIILTRHGHVEGIRPVRFRGRSDLALTDIGLAQAAATAARIAEEWRPQAIYTSPLDRCVTTARAIARASGVVVQVASELNDIDYGGWQGKTHEEASSASPELYREWIATPHRVRFPGGESLQDIAVRTADILRRVWREHRDATVVLVGHECVNRVLLLQAFDMPLSAYWLIGQDPCSVSEIDISDQEIRVLRLNETHHLRASLRRGESG